ncbi:hypothetical protein [Hymenobacter pini]|uniref:hypothetical protein n=1 Tax=Hymenobacter pini TaxID=2880879 RepID=UPI001CF244DD|nr:hypothetical protein [Hymenobacter pini]
MYQAIEMAALKLRSIPLRKNDKTALQQPTTPVLAVVGGDGSPAPEAPCRAAGVPEAGK